MLDATNMRVVEPVTVVDLPVGQSVVLRATAESVNVQGDWSPTTTYATLTDTELMFIVCSASSRHEDRWLSIADTFEFLPTD